MHYLIYVSQAGKPFTQEALKDLLEQSRARNRADGITGLLLYRYVAEADRGSFLQILEGDRAAVEDVWARISKDRRHHSLVALEEAEAPARMFADWSMGFRDAGDEALAGYPGYADLGSDAFWRRLETETPPGALDLLRSFYQPG